MGALTRSASYGGNVGDPFDDREDGEEFGPIREIVIQAGDRVDAIRVVYHGGFVRAHGGAGGSEHRITLAPDEYITKVSGRSGEKLDQITFTSNKAVYGPYGKPGGEPFVIDFGGQALRHVFGRANTEIIQIGFGYGAQPQALPLFQCTNLKLDNDGALVDVEQLRALTKQLIEHEITDLIIHAHGLNAGPGMFGIYWSAAYKALSQVIRTKKGGIAPGVKIGGCALEWDAEGAWGLVVGTLQERAAKIGTVFTRLLRELVQSRPGLRVHLSGHSTGTVLAVHAVMGGWEPAETPIRSLFLMQGILPANLFSPGKQSGSSLEDVGKKVIKGVVELLISKNARETLDTVLEQPGAMAPLPRFVNGPIIATRAPTDSDLKYLIALQVLPMGIAGLVNVDHPQVGLDQVGARLDFSGHRLWTLNIGDVVGSNHNAAMYEQRVAWSHLCAAKVAWGQ